MMSGSARPGNPAGINVRATNGFNSPMTTNSFMLVGDEDLRGTRDGLVPVTSTARSDEVRKMTAKSNFAHKFENGCQVLQKHLIARGMTPFFPRPLAGPLADPIVGSHRGTEEGFRLRKQVAILSVDLEALAKKAGSPHMFTAFASAVASVAEAGVKYIPVRDYAIMVTDAFMADPRTAVAWHMLGRGYNPYTPEGVLKYGVADLVSVVKGARLLNDKWRIPLVTVRNAAVSFDKALLNALNGLYAMDHLPTVVQVMDAAADVFKNGVENPNPGNNGGDSGGEGRSNPFKMSKVVVTGTIHRV